MESQFRFVFVVFCVAAVLILTVYLRGINNRNFYKLCLENAEQGRLKQQLIFKQLQLESIINPATISQLLGESKSGAYAR